jgi:hypothetical protein
MAVWKFADGSTLESGGAVSGSHAAAQALREELGEKPTVQVFPPPGDETPVVLSSDYLLDLFARKIAQRTRVKMSTEYERDIDDAPKALRDALFEFRAVQHRAPYNTMY